MQHSFDVEIASKYGVHAAILLNNLYFWIEKNRANDANFYDGHYWTYNSKKAFAELFPYMNSRQIDYALKKLIDDGIVITGNYNKSSYDRTLWYAITKKGYSILQNCKMETTKLGNGFDEIVKPIPDINAFTKNTDVNTDSKRGKTASRFTPPTLEQVIDYCNQRQNGVDPERFYDYYTSNGWKVGKNSMKDWQAAVRTWERSETPKPPQRSAIPQHESAIDKARRMAAYYEAQEAEDEDDET